MLARQRLCRDLQSLLHHYIGFAKSMRQPNRDRTATTDGPHSNSSRKNVHNQYKKDNERNNIRQVTEMSSQVQQTGHQQPKCNTYGRTSNARAPFNMFAVGQTNAPHTKKMT